MKDDDQSCDYAEFYPDHETGADDQSVGKIMDTVSDKVKITKGVDIANPFMAVPPVEISFHNKENYESDNYIKKNIGVPGLLHCFRQNMQEGAADQAASGKSD